MSGEADSESEGAYKEYMCAHCGFVYSEADGLPDHGIPPGTRWTDVPDDWTCPDCGTTKDDFDMFVMN